MKSYYTYIAANSNNTVFYIGVTNALNRRSYEHKHKLTKGFTSKYNIEKIVYYEETNDVKAALEREKQLKRWHRDWKINLIIKSNPGFKDLLEDAETSSA